jgi:hypothetical protein
LVGTAKVTSCGPPGPGTVTVTSDAESFHVQPPSTDTFQNGKIHASSRPITLSTVESLRTARKFTGSSGAPSSPVRTSSTSMSRWSRV